MDEPRKARLLDELRQVRVMLALAILMVCASFLVDPPASTMGTALDALTLVLLMLAALRIHRSCAQLKSFPSNS